MLNGRENGDSSNFTRISGRGKSVVDYCITQVDNMSDLKNFEVETMNDFCDISIRVILIRKPNHSLLRWSITVSHSFGNRNVSLEQEKCTDKILWAYPNGNKEECLYQLQLKLKKLEDKLGNIIGVTNIDELYEEFSGSIFECLDHTISIKSTTKRRVRKSKPWFNRELWRLR